MNILAALDDPQLLGASIKNPVAWRPWRSLLGLAFGLPMDDEAATLFRACTGRQALPSAPFAFLWLCIGRRGGKSFAMSILACYLAAFRDWRPFLSPGERAVVLLVAADREQAKILIRYINGILAAPVMQTLVVNTTADSVELKGSVVLEVVTRSYRSVRGRSVCVAILDELAFWRTDLDSTDPDRDVLDAIRASMATFGKDGMLIGASSPSGRRGVLWDAFARWYGTEDPANLVWRASTAVMNPTVTKTFLDSEFERMDLASYNAEYLAEFRSDVGAFISRDRVDQVVVRGRRELPPLANIHYVGFVDASGGSASSMTCAVAYRDHNGKAILAATRERTAPFSPEAVTQEFSEFLKGYAISKVVGDSFGGAYPQERFRACGIQYERSEKSKNDIYKDFLPLINSEQVELLDDNVLINQLCGLERSISRTGQETVSPPKDRRDDIVNAAAGAITSVSYESAPVLISYTDFYQNGAPLPDDWDHRISHVYVYFISAAVDAAGRCAIVHWAGNPHGLKPRLAMRNYECGYFTEARFSQYARLLGLCYSACSTRRVAAVTEGIYAAMASDVMVDFGCAATAARLVSAGEVKITQAVHEKSSNSPIHDALNFRHDRLQDALPCAAICGVVMGLVGPTQ